MAETTDNRSKLKEFIASIATIRGDLSNISAPPFVLDTKSAVELPAFWAERPSVFVAPAASDDPAERALLVLKWLISSLRNQQYAGRPEGSGVKKPLNAFLGELFLAKWEDEAGLTRIVSEQVSHHPPVTACRVWNDEHGVSAEGYTRQEVTFSGSVNIRQIGHATLHLAHHDETYLIPLPNVKLKNIISGSRYPEIQGSYTIPSTNGYTSSIDFSGNSFFSSSSDKKHSFEAKVYQDAEPDTPLYTLSGKWDGQFTIHDCTKDVDVETFDVRTAKTTPMATDPIPEQDPWESRRAWKETREALERGDMQATTDAKTRLENGQREMRKTDDDGKAWKRLFYKADTQPNEVAGALAKKIGVTFDATETLGVWKFRQREWESGAFKKPYRGNLRPNNSNSHKEVSDTAGAASTGQAPQQGYLDRMGSFHRQTTIDSTSTAQNGDKSLETEAAPKTPSTQVEPVDRVPPVAHAQSISNGNVSDKTARESPIELSMRNLSVPDTNQYQSQLQNGHQRKETHPAETDISQTQDGDRRLSVQEKSQVEEFLRDQYSTRRSSKTARS